MVLSAWWFVSPGALFWGGGVPFFSHLFLFGVVWFHTRVPLGPRIPGIILLYDVLYTWHAFIHACRVLLPLLPLLLLLLLLCTGVFAASAAVVPHGVPDGKKCCWFIEYDSIQCFLVFIQARFIFNVCTLGSTVAFIASIYLDCVLGKAGVSPPRGSPPCTWCICINSTSSGIYGHARGPPCTPVHLRLLARYLSELPLFLFYRTLRLWRHICVDVS